MSAIKLLLTTPLMWVIYLLVTAIVLFRGACRSSRRARYGWYALLTGTVLLAGLSFTPLSHAFIRSLEARYEPPSHDILASLDAVVVLGGGGRGGRPSSATYQRITEGVEILKASGTKLLILQGAAEVEGEPTDAEVMRQIALAQGVRADEILIDPLSRTTQEHPAQLARLLPRQVTQIGIATSALHMPRAFTIFHSQLPELKFVPLPVDRAGTGGPYAFKHFIPSADALGSSTAALHEWIGIAWYTLRY